ncbi:Hypothetical predicted protein [Pelobates cultripes]|uniref:L1 transposable element RRM domain-containing protein n=1 Tax=Pelobates cultripes TaxID=61616 RepID=A0AAD1SCT8_PELCU|nr:Hypothetical predicted protein [Pelobates cultripes]
MATKKSQEDRKKKEKKDLQSDKRLSGYFSPAPSQQKTQINPEDSEENLETNYSLIKEAQIKTPMTEDVLTKNLEKFHRAIGEDMTANMRELKQEFKMIQVKLAEMEENLKKFEKKHNTCQETIAGLTNKIGVLETKICDMEDRSRRANIRIRNIPEEVSNEKLEGFLLEFFKNLISDGDLHDYLTDRCHRLPKPYNASETLVRDVMVKFHSYKTKERIMAAMRNKPTVEEKFKNLIIFQDLSFSTRSWRKTFKDLLPTLRQKNINYRWGFPSTLRVFWNGKTENFDSKESLNSWMELTKIK